MFCVVLWFNPVGAQQLKKAVVEENNNTELKMDKAVPQVQQLQRMQAAKGEARLDFQPVQKVLKAKEHSTNPKYSELQGLTQEQKLNMVKESMRRAFAPKAGAAGQKTFIGGALLSIDILDFGIMGRFTIDETGPSVLEDMDCPIYNSSYNGFPFYGTWNGKYFEGMWAAIGYLGSPAQGQIAGLFGYYIYDPATDQVGQLQSTVAATGISSPYSAYIAYDYSKGVNYALQKYETQIQQGVWACDSIQVLTAAPNTGVYTRIGKVSGITTGIIAMTMTKEGTMYVIALDGKLYTINTTTWEATEVGDTKITPFDTYQAMAADYVTGKLYWNYYDENEDMGIAEVNATTGEATILGEFENELTCMASFYYPNNEPIAIADFGLNYSGGKVNASFTVPTLTMNGDVIESLDTVEIVKVTGNTSSRIWSKQNPTVGEKISIDLENVGNSGETVTLGIRVKDANGKYSALATASVLIFDITLPYVNGFETDATDPMAAIVVVDPQNQGGMERTQDQAHEGSYSFKMAGSYYYGDPRKLNIMGVPVKKGGVYGISFWHKTNVTQEGLIVTFDGASPTTAYATQSSKWTQYSNYYEATATGQMLVTLQGYGNSSQNAIYYIDDIEITELVSPDVPAPFIVNNVTAAPNGALEAVINITLPSETMAEETLTTITSLELEIATSSSFTAANTTTKLVTEGLTPGATINVNVPVTKAGKYYIRGSIANEVGECPYYSAYTDATGQYYQASPWIGSDMPTSVTITATPNQDGTVSLEWEAPVAKNGGYIGTVTYKLSDAAGTELYSGTDLTFTTQALALGMHTLTFQFADNAATQTMAVNTLGGIQQGMIYSNVSRAGTTDTRVLNVSATANNSAFAQMLYPATNNAMYIDTLLLFATAPNTGEAKQYTKIYMGTTDLTAFGGTTNSPSKDFVEKEQLTQVFADTLRFKAGENMLKLPLQGFYYDGTKSLVISIVKPMQERTTFAAAAYVAVSENNMLKYRAVSNSIDFDTVSSYNEYTGTPNAYSVSMVAAPGAELKTLEVTVTDAVSQEAVEDAIIDIERDAEDNADGKNLNARITTGADGKATFGYMPQGRFVVKVQKAAYIAVVENVEVTSATASPVAIAIQLIKAKEVNVNGSVQDKGGNALAGVAVKAAGLAEFTATTDAQGEFELEGVFAPGEYTLSFEKQGMNTLAIPFVLGEEDTTLASVEMAYNVMPVPMATAAEQDGNAVISWKQPAASVMISWVESFTQIRRLTIDNETPFRYAQRFLPADLAAMKLGGAKALRFGFFVTSEEAEYSILVASDTTHELYRQQVPADKLVYGEWCEIDIPADVTIDLNKELWLIVETSGTDYPCGATTTGTVAGKGNLIEYQGKWYPITDLFTNGQGNVLIHLLVEDPTTSIEAANGYRVYRGLAEDDFEDYTLLTEQTVKTTTYTDAAYSTLPFGEYNYAVVADWYGEDLSEPTFTNVLNKGMEFTVSFKITSNAGSAKGAYVYMLNEEETREYEATANEQGVAAIAKKVWRGVYDYEVSMDFHGLVEGKIDVTQDTVIEVALQEIIADPELTAQVEGMDVVVNYGVNLHNWFDDVESYPDFAISGVDPWIINQGTYKYGVQDCNWPNNDQQQSWIVFNPSKTTPALNWAPYSGEKYFLSMVSGEGVNNDYLVRSVTKGGGIFTFFVRAVSSVYPESFEVVYSNTTADFSAFKTLTNGNVANFASTTWARGTFSIPQDAKYIGLRCTSDDAFGLLADNLSYTIENPANPTGYELYLDGEKVADVAADVLTYTFSNLSLGEHKVGVKAVYASGTSKLVEESVKISAEAMPVDLTATVKEDMAVLTWDMPEGFTPQGYKVFLNDEQKVEGLTEKTYTFSELENGKYTAAVLAVYESGESEKATVEFEIKKVEVGTEDFDMAVRSKVYPNPSNGLFYLQAAHQGLVEVYSMTGQMVKRVEIPAAGTYTLDLQNRSNGIYLIKFANGNDMNLFKVVIR